jgi:hypothetical protein
MAAVPYYAVSSPYVVPGAYGRSQYSRQAGFVLGNDGMVDPGLVNGMNFFGLLNSLNSERQDIFVKNLDGTYKEITDDGLDINQLMILLGTNAGYHGNNMMGTMAWLGLTNQQKYKRNQAGLMEPMYQQTWPAWSEYEGDDMAWLFAASHGIGFGSDGVNGGLTSKQNPGYWMAKSGLITDLLG